MFHQSLAAAPQAIIPGPGVGPTYYLAGPPGSTWMVNGAQVKLPPAEPGLSGAQAVWYARILTSDRLTREDLLNTARWQFWDNQFAEETYGLLLVNMHVDNLGQVAPFPWNLVADWTRPLWQEHGAKLLADMVSRGLKLFSDAYVVFHQDEPGFFRLVLPFQKNSPAVAAVILTLAAFLLVTVVSIQLLRIDPKESVDAILAPINTAVGAIGDVGEGIEDLATSVGQGYKEATTLLAAGLGTGFKIGLPILALGLAVLVFMNYQQSRQSRRKR